MRKYFFCLVLTTLFACQKSDTSPGTASLSFKADGITHTYSGDWKQLEGTGCTIDPLFTSSLGYIILAGVGARNTDGFEAHIPDNTVRVSTYTNTVFELYLSGAHYLGTNDGTVAISRVANGRADGTFNGRVTRVGGSAMITITEGMFSNVPIR